MCDYNNAIRMNAEFIDPRPTSGKDLMPAARHPLSSPDRRRLSRQVLETCVTQLQITPPELHWFAPICTRLHHFPPQNFRENSLCKRPSQRRRQVSAGHCADAAVYVATRPITVSLVY